MNKKIPAPLAILIIFFVIAIIVCIAILNCPKIPESNISYPQNESNKSIACTQEAKFCPDGSYVSRTGLNCEFAECPSVKNETIEGCVINPYQGEELEFADIEKDVRGGAVCHFYINNDLSIYNFNLVGNPEYNTIERIEITKGNEDIISQVLEFEMVEPPLLGVEFFFVEDINFDGYKDIALLNWWGATGNRGYLYWLFDYQKNQFILNEDLNGLSNPTPHPETKTITTHSKGGMAGSIYSDGTYEFDNNGKLILIRLEKQEWIEDKQYLLKTISERINGEMVIISTSTTVLEDY